MKILFVDDEQRILDAIQRSLFDTDWEIHCSCSAEAALELLAIEKFDVIVSDMRMPGMDGAELLKNIYQRYPDTVRIILSGHADQSASMRASLVAHQWLHKPCDRESLVSTLSRIEAGLDELPDNDVKLAVGKTNALPSPPKTFIRIHQLLSQGSASLENIAAVIAEDPALTAKILQLTNSSFFSRGVHIADVKDAVVRLGYDLISGVVLLVESYTKVIGNNFLNIHEEQLHALAISKLASKIVPTELKEAAVLAGLLHEIGKHVLVRAFPEQADAYVSGYKEKNSPDDIVIFERGVFGTDHAQLGAYLLLLWGFPSAVIDGVLYHHSPEKLLQESFGVPAAVYIADTLIHHLEPNQQFVEHFGLQERLSEWKNMANSHD